MALEGKYTKLTIEPEGTTEDGKPAAAIEVMFNPNTYTVTKTASWNKAQDSRANAPTVAFGGGGARELSLELFFDVTESGNKVDVRQHSDRIVALAYVMRDKAKPRPPICTITWGPMFRRFNQSYLSLPFKGLLTSVAQKFTLFDASGRPLRATLNVTFTEFLSREIDRRITDPEQTTHTWRRGESLDGIARKYGVGWRDIANENLRLFPNNNPRLAVVGAALKVPKV